MNASELTREAIESMEAGRRMDAQVAAMLGWRAWKETRGDYTLCVTTAPGEHEPWKQSRYDQQERQRGRYTEVDCLTAQTIGFFGREFPRFSTDIAAAIEVAERFKRFDFGKPYMRGEKIADYWARLWSHVRDVPPIGASTLPLAICRAALLTTLKD